MSDSRLVELDGTWINPAEVAALRPSYDGAATYVWMTGASGEDDYFYIAMDVSTVLFILTGQE
jgi:hypothetical protein